MNRVKVFSAGLCIVFSMLGVWGCGAEKSQEAQLITTPTPSPNIVTSGPQATLYIIRTMEPGFAVPFKVNVDGKYIGDTQGNKCLMVKIDPGTHQIESKAENLSTLSLTTEPGQVYYVKQQSMMGVMYARNKLEILDSEKGQKALSNCKFPK